MAMCPNGCGINHRTEPSPTNCKNYHSANMSADGSLAPVSLKPKKGKMSERYAQQMDKRS